jgi:hypothetical protein
MDSIGNVYISFAKIIWTVLGMFIYFLTRQYGQYWECLYIFCQDNMDCIGNVYISSDKIIWTVLGMFIYLLTR